jgi:hypothetical protein
VSAKLESIRSPDKVCQRIVKRVFQELQERGVAEEIAFESATTVYRFHHPEVPKREAQFKIAEWLDYLLTFSQFPQSD